MKKRFLTFTLAMMLAITALTGCNSKESTPPKKESLENSTEILPDSKKVVLNEVAHSIFYAPMYVCLLYTSRCV